MKLKIFMLLSCLALLSSCIKEVDEDFNFKSKIALFAFITNEDANPRIILLNNSPVTQANPSGKANYNYIENATVKMYNEEGEEVLLSFKDEGYTKFYQTDSSVFKFKEDKKYFINVSTLDGRTCNASFISPRGVLPKNTKCDTNYISTLEFDPNGLSIMKKKLKLNIEFSPLNDYYFVYSKVYYHCISVDKHGVRDTSSDWQQLFFSEQTDKPQAYIGEQNLETFTTITSSSFDTVSAFHIYLDSIEYRIAAANKEYDQFLNSVETQSSNINDPFAEPTILYSNIQGGLGFFTGLTIRSKKIKY